MRSSFVFYYDRHDSTIWYGWSLWGLIAIHEKTPAAPNFFEFTGNRRMTLRTEEGSVRNSIVQSWRPYIFKIRKILETPYDIGTHVIKRIEEQRAEWFCIHPNWWIWQFFCIICCIRFGEMILQKYQIIIAGVGVGSLYLSNLRR